MSSAAADDYSDPFDRPLGYADEALPDGRVPQWVMGGIGDQARGVTPWNMHSEPALLSLAEIACDAGIPVGEGWGASSLRSATRQGGMASDSGATRGSKR